MPTYDLPIAAIDILMEVGIIVMHQAAWRVWRSRSSGRRRSDVILMVVLSLPLVATASISTALHGGDFLTRFGLRPRIWDPLAAIAIIVGAQLLGAALVKVVRPAPDASASVHVQGSEQEGVRPPKSYDLLAPASEELVFRGLLLGGLSALVPVSVAVLVQGVVFGALHLRSSRPSVLHALQAGSVGIAAGAVTAQQDGRLLPALIAHYFFNLLGPKLNELAERRGAPTSKSGP